MPTVWIGFTISALAVGIFIAQFDMRLVRDSLMRVRWWSLLLGGLVFLGSYMVRGLRWKYLVQPLQRIPWSQARDVLMVGFMLNCTLPARAGEVARAFILWRVAGTSRRGGLATVGVERIFDGFCLVGMVSLVGLAFEVPSQIRHGSYVVSAIMTVGLALVLWLAFHHSSFFVVFSRALFFVPGGPRARFTGFFERFVDGTRALRDPGLMLRVGLLTMTVWGLEVLVYLSVMRGFDIQLPLWCVVMVLAAVNFSIAVPSAPAYLGVYEAACGGAVVALSAMLGYPMTWELALSYSIALHLTVFVCIVGPGLILMWNLGLRFTDLTSPNTQDVKADPDP